MLFRRRLKFSVEINKELKIYEHTSEEPNLKVTFNVTRSLGQQENATFSVIGLNLQDIQELSTKFDYKTGKAKPNKVILEAGYTDDYGKIFEGAITECEPKIDSSDFTLDIKAQAGYYNSTMKREPISIINARLSDIARTIAEGYAMSLSFNAIDKQIGDYSFNGSVNNQFKLFAKQYGVKAWIENNIVFVSDTDKPKQSQATLISGESGLIGNPSPMARGVSFTTLLRPSITLNSKVKCEFVKFPMLSGDYKVISVTHKGSNYGNEFSSSIEAVRL